MSVPVVAIENVRGLGQSITITRDAGEFPTLTLRYPGKRSAVEAAAAFIRGALADAFHAGADEADAASRLRKAAIIAGLES